MTREYEYVAVVEEAGGGLGAARGVGLAGGAARVVHERMRAACGIAPVGHPGWELLVDGGSAGSEDVKVFGRL